MSVSITNSRFKSAFGEPPLPQGRRISAATLAPTQPRIFTRRPLSFFDSQRVDRKMMYVANGNEEVEEVYDEQIDINH